MLASRYGELFTTAGLMECVSVRRFDVAQAHLPTKVGMLVLIEPKDWEMVKTILVCVYT